MLILFRSKWHKHVDPRQDISMYVLWVLFTLKYTSTFFTCKSRHFTLKLSKLMLMLNFDAISIVIIYILLYIVIYILWYKIHVFNTYLIACFIYYRKVEYKASVGSLDHFIIMFPTKFCFVISKANFSIKTGLKQGCILSPTLLSVLMNGLVDMLRNRNMGFELAS